MMPIYTTIPAAGGGQMHLNLGDAWELGIARLENGEDDCCDSTRRY
jgi:hypothetical protein